MTDPADLDRPLRFGADGRPHREAEARVRHHEPRKARRSFGCETCGGDLGVECAVCEPVSVEVCR